jgi:hypothetical protein
VVPNQSRCRIKFTAFAISVQHPLSKALITLIAVEPSCFLYSRPGPLLEDILRKQWIVLSGLRSLRITSRDGTPSNEYRIRQNSVEFRTLDRAGGRSFRLGKWRVLDRDEIEWHFALRTPVANWLDKNLYSAASTA